MDGYKKYDVKLQDVMGEIFMDRDDRMKLSM